MEMENPEIISSKEVLVITERKDSVKVTKNFKDQFGCEVKRYCDLRKDNWKEELDFTFMIVGEVNKRLNPELPEVEV